VGCGACPLLYVILNTNHIHYNNHHQTNAVWFTVLQFFDHKAVYPKCYSRLHLTEPNLTFLPKVLQQTAPNLTFLPKALKQTAQTHLSIDSNMGCQTPNPCHTDVHVTEPRIWWSCW
jgi:hypothetical protein